MIQLISIKKDLILKICMILQRYLIETSNSNRSFHLKVFVSVNWIFNIKRSFRMHIQRQKYQWHYIKDGGISNLETIKFKKIIPRNNNFPIVRNKKYRMIIRLNLSMINLNQFISKLIILLDFSFKITQNQSLNNNLFPFFKKVSKIEIYIGFHINQNF